MAPGKPPNGTLQRERAVLFLGSHAKLRPRVFTLPPSSIQARMHVSPANASSSSTSPAYPLVSQNLNRPLDCVCVVFSWNPSARPSYPVACTQKSARAPSAAFTKHRRPSRSNTSRMNTRPLASRAWGSYFISLVCLSYVSREVSRMCSASESPETATGEPLAMGGSRIAPAHARGCTMAPSYVLVMGPKGAGKTTAYEKVLSDLRASKPSVEDTSATAYFHHHKIGKRVYMRGSRARRNLPAKSRGGGIGTHLRDLARRDPDTLVLVEGGFWRQQNTIAAAKAAGYEIKARPLRLYVSLLMTRNP